MLWASARRRAWAAAVLGGMACATAQVTTQTSALASTGAGGSVDVVYSSYTFREGDHRLSKQPSKTLAPVSNSPTMTINVDPSVTYQTYTGMGSTFEDATVYHLMRLSPANREAALGAMFSEANGNGFNHWRTTIGCADFCRSAWNADGTPGFWTYADGAPDPTLSRFSIARDISDGKIEVLQSALRINPRLQVFASIWSPPAWMKNTNSITHSRIGTCPAMAEHERGYVKPEYYPVLAEYFARYIEEYKKHGIPIYAVTLQNEPDVAMPYPSTCYDAGQMAAWAKVLKAKFVDRGIETKIWGHDANQPHALESADALLGDPAVSPAINGLGWHNYDGASMWTPQVVQAMYPDRAMHFTEQTTGPYKLVEMFRNGISSYNAWGTMAENKTGCPGEFGTMCLPGPSWWQNRALTEPDHLEPYMFSPSAGDPTRYDINTKYYFWGQFSRYIKPGAKRIDTPGQMGNITSVAFKNPDGTIAVVVVNRPWTQYWSVQLDTPPETIRIATPDGEFYDTIPGDTVATYVITPTTGDALSRTGRTASASHTNSGFTAHQAVDGNAYTMWQSGVNQAAGQSFTIDLGSSRRFDQVTLNQMEAWNDSPARYAVTTSVDGAAWSGTVASGVGTAGLTNIAFAPRTARFIRITLTASASRWWSISEASVYDSGTGLMPTRAGSTATASSTAGGLAASNALDGSMETAWATGAPQTVGQWFRVDLGAPRTFDGFELDSGESSGDYPRGYSVQLSDDGVSWGAVVAQGNGQSHETRIHTGTRTARYVRINITRHWSANWWAIREFRLRSEAPVTAPSTPGTGRAGWLATSSVGTGAQNVLDGNATTRYTSGTAQAPGQSVTIDMRTTYWTTGVRLDSAGFAGDHGRATKIDVSTNGTSWRTVADVVGLQQTNRVVWPTAAARFVRITQTLATPGNWWSLAEVDVDGVPLTVPTLGTPVSKSGWTATSSGGSGPESRVFDGKINDTHRWTTGKAVNGSEFMQVDLGATRTVRAVQLLMSASPYSPREYAKEYEVHVSTGGAWTKVAAGNGHGPVQDIAFRPVSARYIHVKNVAASGDPWSIGEVNVFR